MFFLFLIIAGNIFSYVIDTIKHNSFPPIPAHRQSHYISDETFYINPLTPELVFRRQAGVDRLPAHSPRS